MQNTGFIQLKTVSFEYRKNCRGTSSERPRLPKAQTYIPEIHLIWAKHIYSFDIFIAFNDVLME